MNYWLYAGIHIPGQRFAKAPVGFGTLSLGRGERLECDSFSINPGFQPLPL
jgi:hypothetical protein